MTSHDPSDRTPDTQISPPEPRAIARRHIVFSVLTLVIFVATAAAVDRCSFSPRVIRYFDDRNVARCRSLNRAYVRTGNFPDEFDGLLFDEIPKINYAAGGVYFFGSSNLVFSGQFENLPPGEAPFFHNFGFPSANPNQIFQLIQYLDRQHGLLTLAPTKTRIALCMAGTDLFSMPTAGGFLPSALSATGVFGYTARDGIELLPMSGWKRSYAIRKVRWHDFLQLTVAFTVHLPPAANDVQAFKADQTRMIALSSPDSEAKQIAYLNQMLKYLKSKNVEVTIVRLPRGSWTEDSPLERQFNEGVLSLCPARGVAILDLSHLLRDDEFMDGRHPNIHGAPKVRDALEAFGRQSLQRAGVLPTPGEVQHAN